VTLRKEVVTPVVPSKLLSIMASGRPVVASLSKNGDAVKLIHNANCGICVEPENSVEFSQAILQLYGDPELRDKFSFNGRQYAEKHFSKPIIINHYENILLSAK
jgi:glycosyltransferase involved in cell wall biosynthesis